MDFNPNTQTSQQTTENPNAELIAKDRLENVDTIRQILFGEDRRILDAKIQHLTTMLERLTKAHQDDLANLESRLRTTHAEETNSVKRSLSEASMSQKNALEAIAINVGNAINTSNTVLEKKINNLQLNLQSQTAALAQLKTENMAMHDSASKGIEEKLVTVDKKILSTSLSLNNYITTKKFSDALRALANQFDTLTPASTPEASNTQQPFQR